MYVVTLKFNNTGIDEFRCNDRPKVTNTGLEADWVGKEPIFINWHEVRVCWITKATDLEKIDTVKKEVFEDFPEVLGFGKK